MRIFSKAQHIALGIAVFSISLLIFPGLYDRYVFSLFYARSFEMDGETYVVEYPARLSGVSGKEDVIVERVVIFKSSIIFDSKALLIRVHPAGKPIEQVLFKKLCESESGDIGEMYIGSDGHLCFARARLDGDLYEFRYLDFPNLSFKSRESRLNLSEIGFSRQ